MAVINWLGKAWLCPECGAVRRRPLHSDPPDGNRWHSWRCGTPMAQVVIEATGK